MRAPNVLASNERKGEESGSVALQFYTGPPIHPQAAFSPLPAFPRPSIARVRACHTWPHPLPSPARPPARKSPARLLSNLRCLWLRAAALFWLLLSVLVPILILVSVLLSLVGSLCSPSILFTVSSTYYLTLSRATALSWAGVGWGADRDLYAQAQARTGAQKGKSKKLRSPRRGTVWVEYLILVRLVTRRPFMYAHLCISCIHVLIHGLIYAPIHGCRPEMAGRKEGRKKGRKEGEIRIHIMYT